MGTVAVGLFRAINPKPDSTAGPGHTPVAGSSAGSSPVDGCVVGVWQITSSHERAVLEVVVAELSGGGGVWRLNADGTGVIDYTGGARSSGRYNGQPVTLMLTGTVSYDFRAVNQRLTFTNVRQSGTVTLLSGGVTVATGPLKIETPAMTYTCDEDQLVVDWAEGRVEMRRS